MAEFILLVGWVVLAIDNMRIHRQLQAITQALFATKKALLDLSEIVDRQRQSASRGDYSFEATERRIVYSGRRPELS